LDVYKKLKRFGIKTTKMSTTPKMQDYDNIKYKRNVSGDVCVMRYYLGNKLHRLNGPAVEYVDRSKAEWYLNGEHHRAPDDSGAHYPAYISGDTQIWYVGGKRHRVGGPAAIYKIGTKEWLQNGLLHRDDGPAVERYNGEKSYYINGKQLTEQEFHERMQSKTEISDIKTLENSEKLECKSGKPEVSVKRSVLGKECSEELMVSIDKLLTFIGLTKSITYESIKRTSTTNGVTTITETERVLTEYFKDDKKLTDDEAKDIIRKTLTEYLEFIG
jgi:hypothetical protein